MTKQTESEVRRTEYIRPEDVQESFGIKKTAYHNRLKFLGIQAHKDEKKKAYLDENQLDKLKKLDNYINKNGKMAGFTYNENSDSSDSLVTTNENGLVTSTNSLVIDNNSTTLMKETKTISHKTSNDKFTLLLGLPITKVGQITDEESNVNRKRRKSYNLDNIRVGRPGKIAAKRGSEPVLYTGDSHLITIAPTGAGKGRSVIIPNLLSYPGPIVVIDPKGENYAVTARRRKDMGQKVIRIDPFGVIDNDSDCFNPLDIFNLSNADVETDAQMLAELLSIDNRGEKEPFWDLSACGLLSGLIAYTVTGKPHQERHLHTICQLLIGKNIDYKIAELLDNQGEKMNHMAFDELASYLGIPEKETRPCVLASAQSYIKAFLSNRVLHTLRKSSFLLNDIVEGKPLSIYLIIPPDKLKSHKALLKLWVGTLLKAIISRKSIPKQRTLFLLDECAQMGNFPFLETVITLCRGYGLQTWSFWQDIAQIEELYRTSYSTIINNCAVLQIFGAKNYLVAKDFAEIVGADTDAIREVNPKEQVLVINGAEPIRCRRFDYLKDVQFQGLYDQNPFYQTS